jgi:hypothetical protein
MADLIAVFPMLGSADRHRRESRELWPWQLFGAVGIEGPANAAYARGDCFGAKWGLDRRHTAPKLTPR